MFITKIILIFILTSKCFAVDLEVKAFNFSYKLEYDKNLITFRSNQTQIKIVKKKCNNLLISDFHKRLSKKLNSSPKRTTKQKYDFSYNVNSAVFYENKKSVLGKFLVKIPNAIRKISIQNVILCSSNTK